MGVSLAASESRSKDDKFNDKLIWKSRQTHAYDRVAEQPSDCFGFLGTIAMLTIAYFCRTATASFFCSSGGFREGWTVKDSLSNFDQPQRVTELHKRGDSLPTGLCQKQVVKSS